MKNDLKPSKDNSVIKIGIDLGTTNSEIAINNNGDIVIVKNANGSEYTPSVFGVNKANNKIVGIGAYDRLYKAASKGELKNNKAEVKRLMGSSEKVHFERLNIDLLPEEISAEILKSLRGDVASKYPDAATIAAVITVPAHFSTLQAEATKRAGQLAGFKYVVLLQEPIAAAMAYGFENTENQNWLVYDLGGGTFDVALISSKDGVLTVLGHDGDNFLGGKDFDWKIVDEVIKPAIQDKYQFTDFERSNKEFEDVFNRLKGLAEKAKIELSQNENIIIEVEDIGTTDNNKKEVYVSIELSRSHFNDLIKPFVDKTIELVRKTLKESGVEVSTIAKIIPVGGPTQIQFVRQTLEREFNLKVDSSIDPLTVVAKGACIFGLGQRIPKEVLLDDHDKDVSEMQVTLHYDSMTSDDEQTVAGIIDSLKDTEKDYYIQIQADSGFYTSSKIKLRNGKFFDTVAIEKAKTNVYWLYLFDDKGNTIPMFPDSFSVTHGTTVSGSPIPHEIGVIYAKKGFESGLQMSEICDPYFSKNSVPPLTKTETYYTIKKLEKGVDQKLPIRVYEDQHGSGNPKNVPTLTKVIIEGKKLPYDLPEKTAVEITISIDESRTVLVTAYIPIIELSLNVRADTHAQPIDVSDLEQDLDVQKDRLKKAEANMSSNEHDKLENQVKDLSDNIKNANLDTDAKNKTERDLRELKITLDRIESEKELPQLKSGLLENIKDAESFIALLESESEKAELLKQLNPLIAEAHKAIQAEDKTMIIRVNEQVEMVGITALRQNPSVWIHQLNIIRGRKNELSNQTDGEYYFDKADKAVADSDFEELQRCVRSLLDLLPVDIQEQITANVAGITK